LNPEIIKIQIVILTVLISIYTDLKKGKIFNVLTFPFFFGGFIFNFITKGTEGIFSSFLGFLVCFIPFYMFFWLGGVGGGDVKLMAGIGSWVGYPDAFYFLFFTAISGLVISLIFSVFKGRIKNLLRGIVRESKGVTKKIASSVVTKEFRGEDFKESKESIPYSLAIGLGTFISFFIVFKI
jgi:prepilin peptidase CpaA